MNSQKINQPATMVGSEVENPLPTTLHETPAVINDGLPWIFTKKMIPNEIFLGEENN